MSQHQNPNLKQPLFRPYLTKEEITLIYSLLDTKTGEYEHLEEHSTLKRKIKELMFRISENLITPSHIREKKQSIEDQLGISDSRENRKQFLYENFHLTYKNSITQLTKEEIDLINEYRYENDLMSPEEETEYLSNLTK